MALLERLAAAFLGVQSDCADIVGAVLATPDGLVLAGSGTLGSDTAAAAAAFVADHLDQNLLLVSSPACREAVFWTSDALWGLCRLPSRHVVLAQAQLACGTGTLRLALGRLRRDLAASLSGVE